MSDVTLMLCLLKMSYVIMDIFLGHLARVAQLRPQIANQQERINALIEAVSKINDEMKDEDEAERRLAPNDLVNAYLRERRELDNMIREFDWLTQAIQRMAESHDEVRDYLNSVNAWF